MANASPGGYRVINHIFSTVQFWDDRAATLEEQAKGPIATPIEMRMTHEMVVDRVRRIPGYVTQVREVFGTDEVTSLSRARSGLRLAGGLLTLFIDQQQVSEGTTTVNAIRLVGDGALAGLDIIVSQSVAGMRC